MTSELTPDEKFATLVLELKRRNPSFTAANIADELESHEIPPTSTRAVLRKKISRILLRGTTKRKKRVGIRTVRTQRFKKEVKKLIHLKNYTRTMRIHDE